MSYILRALDYEPDSHDMLELAHLMVWGCIGVHHSCREPLSEVQINDPRIDRFFSECSICSLQWIPSPSVFESLISPDKILLTSSTGVGGYCQNCKKAFCREHVADPLPTQTLGGNPHCPLCKRELDCHHTYGRKARQASRLNTKLLYAILIRDGLIPPDKEYCLKVFRCSSSDVLEDLPSIIGMNLQPWEYQAGLVLDQIRDWLKTQTRHNYTADQTAIWSGLDTETNSRFHLVKVWGSSPKVTLDNLLTIPQHFENFSFETATISNESFPESQVVFPNKSTDVTEHTPNITSHPNAAVVQEFVDLFEQYFFEVLSKVPDPRRVSPSQLETLNMTAVNRAGDKIMLKYGLTEQEAAKIAEQAIQSMKTSTSK